MKNKLLLKKNLILLSIIIFILTIIYSSINIYEYKKYNENYNLKISSIINLIIDKYPDIKEEEILNILSNKDNNIDIFKQYNIDIKNDIIIDDNTRVFKVFIIINSIFYLLTIFIIVYVFLRYNKKKDIEINKITKCIEEINNRNYKLELDDISEDELSILKNEIYKTTITLKEAADNSNKEKLELKNSLSDISHQIKTPLTSILILLDNLIDDVEMDTYKREEFIKDIKREINNINFFIQTILKLSKLDTNTIKFTKSDIKCSTLINESIKKVSVLCDLKNINIICNIDEDININCDLKWQIEAISNILKNCIEHSLNKSNIYIEASNTNTYIKIVIKDNGSGIDSEDIPYIFNRFYKGKNSSNDSIGIGLSLAKSIIEKDNGKIYVESNHNGTTFTIKYFKF